jgi:hypothetical protein
VEFAGAHTDEGELHGVFRLRLDLEAAAFVRRRPHSFLRRKEEFLPGVWADYVPEEGAVFPVLEAVGAIVLLVGPAGGNVLRGSDLGLDDRVLPNGGTDGRVPLLLEDGEKLIQPRAEVNCSTDIRHEYSLRTRCPNQSFHAEPGSEGG